MLGMYSAADPVGCYRQADEAFKRALALNPDLPLAHNLYTNLEVELGKALQAMLRLLKRAQTRAADAELFAGLVQACRYCGLLNAAVEAYERARRLDPEIRTSVNHAFLMLGDYARAIESNVEDPPTLNALSLWLMGRQDEAVAFLRKVEESTVTSVHRLFVVANRTLLEGDRQACAESTARLLGSWRPRDPCPLFYLARHLAFLGDSERALEMLEQAVEGGFYPYRFLARDPWLDGVRGESRFVGILRTAEARYHEALDAFVQAGGNRVLGLGKAVEVR